MTSEGLAGLTEETWTETSLNAWKTAHGEGPSMIQVVKSMDDVKKM